MPLTRSLLKKPSSALFVALNLTITYPSSSLSLSLSSLSYQDDPSALKDQLPAPLQHHVERLLGDLVSMMITDLFAPPSSEPDTPYHSPSLFCFY